MSGDVPTIGQQTQPPTATFEDVVAGLPGVMGDGEGLHPDIADLKPWPCTGDEVEPLDACARGTAPGAGRGPDRDAMAAGQSGNPAEVVAMLVGDQDALEVSGTDPELGEPPLRLAETEAAVHQQAGGTRRHQQGIATAPAAEGGEAHP